MTWKHVAFAAVVAVALVALAWSGHVDALGAFAMAFVAVIGAWMRSPAEPPRVPATLEHDTRNGAAPPDPPLA